MTAVEIARAFKARRRRSHRRLRRARPRPTQSPCTGACFRRRTPTRFATRSASRRWRSGTSPIPIRSTRSRGRARRSGRAGTPASGRSVLDAARGGAARLRRRAVAGAVRSPAKSSSNGLIARARETAVSVEGKHAVVTGGSRGIGLAIATRLAQAGARVSIISRSAVARNALLSRARRRCRRRRGAPRLRAVPRGQRRDRHPRQQRRRRRDGDALAHVDGDVGAHPRDEPHRHVPLHARSLCGDDARPAGGGSSTSRARPDWRERRTSPPIARASTASSA